MICSSDDDTQDENRIKDRKCHKGNLGQGDLLCSFALESLQYSGVVQEGATDHKGVGKVKAGHGGKLVHRLTTNPDTFSVALSYGVIESIRVRKESWGHAGIDAKHQEGGEISQGHGPPSDRERSVVLGHIVIP